MQLLNIKQIVLCILASPGHHTFFNAVHPHREHKPKVPCYEKHLMCCIYLHLTLCTFHSIDTAMLANELLCL